jgi:ATP-dependent DNA helicase RecQ
MAGAGMDATPRADDRQSERAAILARCVSVDLEVDPKTARLFAFAAVTGADGAAVVHRGGVLAHSLDRLEMQCAGARHIVGHNILRHDLPHMVAQRPHLARLSGAAIDTLWLNPLAFPRNPYHHLVKHYQDGRLQAGHVNDPEADARLVLQVLDNQMGEFRRMARESPDALAAYHFLTTRGEAAAGFEAVFAEARGAQVPSRAEAHGAIRRLLEGKACAYRTDQTLMRMAAPEVGWPLAYSLSWISVAGGDSVMPPWVRAQFREASVIVRHLRDSDCGDAACVWCRENNDPRGALTRWFGFPGFRPEPADAHGVPLQERIVAESMAGQSVLGILPTGTGKSVCYQVPALSKFDKTGALTVVISPLVALMADQIAGLQRAGVSAAVTVNGMLSLTERQDALDKVRMGDAAMLIISPEQLRSRSVRSVLQQREVGLWVLDEAHCVSKWGHDFRPDYRYVARFIRESAGEEGAQVLCLTATAKPDVVRDIRSHFEDRLGVVLDLLDGGAVRTNLSFAVEATQKATKLADILRVIEAHLPMEGRSGAIVYCATKKETERVAAFLGQQGMAAAHFHSEVPSDTKREVQEAFQRGDLRVIAATNAFGMGIDKPDIRLVVHGDIPGSLENYLQEAGRAGRDRDPAVCVLLYSGDDVERQFSLSARSRLARHEIGAILKALRRLDVRMKKEGEVVATPGEIVREDEDREFLRDSTTDDTRVKTAVAWLEEARLLTRDENAVQVFPSSLRIRAVEEAEAILNRHKITGAWRDQLLAIVREVMNAAPDAGISTDRLMGGAGISAGLLRKALADLETMGIASNDTAVTVFVHHGVEDASVRRLDLAAGMEKDLLTLMREAAPEAETGEAHPLQLTETCQALREAGHATVRPDLVEKLLRGMAMDGRDMEGGRGNLHLRKASRNTLFLRLQRTWGVLERVAELRHQAARTLLGHLLGRLAKGQRGKDIQVETTLGDLLAALNGDAFLRGEVQDMNRLMDRALLWMHEQQVVLLGRGLTVFRPAMTLRLDPGGRPFTVENFAPLEEHYGEQTIQTHVMASYAERGLVAMPEAQRLSEDYFVMERDAFLARWLPEKRGELRRQTTTASWRRIVEDLGNPVQEGIVRDDREQTNVLVLAGPGSGKTRVLVHRIAYLVRVRREDPRGILCLTYNRHAAAEVRERLRRLIGEEATFVTVKTCHALAMRLVGASFAGEGPRDFDAVIREAVRLLRGEGLSKGEAEALRETLIEGYRWILVDEYQDVGPDEYELIAAVAGRTQEDPELRLSLFAVGDDDQNIYAFTGASVDFIRRFEADYHAKPVFLTENYRSTAHVVAAANAVIGKAGARMKAGHDITVDRARAKAPPGGDFAVLDPVGQGRVQVLTCPPGDGAQAVAAVEEMLRLSTLDPEWQWRRCAMIAREWRRLDSVRAYAEAKGIPVEIASDAPLSLWKMREMQAFVRALLADRTRLMSVGDLTGVLNTLPRNRWTEMIGEGIGLLARDVAEKAIPVPDIVEWFGEWSRDARGEQRGLLLLTAHRAKGLEFDHVAILDGGWDRTSRGEDPDAPRRLFYVAMTRARRTLTLMAQGRHALLDPGGSDAVLSRRAAVGEVLPAVQTHVAAEMRLVDLSWAGRLPDGAASLAAIARAQVGDPVQLERRGKDWLVVDGEGVALSRMARAFVPPEGAMIAGEIGAIMVRRQEDNEEEFRAAMRRGEWEVVLPEFVFAEGVR